MALRQKVEVQAHEYRDRVIVPVTLHVSAEYRITLFLNGLPWTIFACSGSNLEELALGHLRAAGTIASPDDIGSVTVDTDNGTVWVKTRLPVKPGKNAVRVETTATGTGQSLAAISADAVPVNPSLPVVEAAAVIPAMDEFLEFSVLHRQTHGVHSAALYSPAGERLCFFDEIGRHNAIDKVLGHALLHRVNLKEVMVLSTGRLANEIIVKLAAAGAAAVVSRAAPTSLSIETARRFNILMIGGVKKSAFYIYHGSESVRC